MAKRGSLIAMHLQYIDMIVDHPYYISLQHWNWDQDKRVAKTQYQGYYVSLIKKTRIEKRLKEKITQIQILSY